LERYDLVIVLGAQIKKENEKYLLAPHTELRARAAANAFHSGTAERFIISGGYNFLVRYNENQILSKADFSFKAFAKSRAWMSEASLIKEYMMGFDIPEEAIFLEELSATTEETAEILKILIRRKPTFDFAKKIAILTLIYHMKRALPVFQNSGLRVEPLFAEDLLALEGKSGIEKVCQYYSVPKGGKQWPVDKIRELLSSGRSIGELLEKPNEKISPLPEGVNPEEMAEKDPKTLWSPGDEKCQHEWVQRWKQEQVKPRWLQHIITALCIKCKREVFLSGNAIVEGVEYTLEPDGSLGMSIPDEGRSTFQY
jgi:uncharacterized SAM-binding protein YcdF (DUF218 family)